jgi:hypothetical protein
MPYNHSEDADASLKVVGARRVTNWLEVENTIQDIIEGI